MCTRSGSGGSGGGVGVQDQNDTTLTNPPELTGSEKQIEWANQIRSDYINRYNKYFDSDELYYVGVGTYNAQEVFTEFYENHILYKYTSKFKELYKTTDGDPKRKKAFEIGQKAYDKYRDQYKTKKAKGIVDKELLQKAKIAKARVYKNEARKLMSKYVKDINDAGDWISWYKSGR